MKMMPSCGELRDIVVDAVNDDDDTLFDFSDGGDSITHMSASELMVKSTDEISVTLQPEDALFGFNMCRAPDRDDLVDLVSNLRGNSYGRRKRRWAKKKQPNGTDGDSISYADDMTSTYSSLGSMKQAPPKNADDDDDDDDTWDGSTLPTAVDTFEKVTEDAEDSIDAEMDDVESSAFDREDESYTVSSVDEGEEVVMSSTREIENTHAPVYSTSGERENDKQQKVTDATRSPRSFGQPKYFKAVEEPPTIERVAFSEDVELFDAKSQQRSNRVRTTATGTPNKSPKSLLEFPPAVALAAAATTESVSGNESMQSLSSTFMHMVSCGAGALPAAVHAVPNGSKKKSPGLPNVLDPEEDKSIGDLTLTSHEKRIDLERYKERLHSVKERAQRRMKKAQDFFGFGPTESEPGNSLSKAKSKDYSREYQSVCTKESQVDDAAQAAMAKQEFYTSSNRRARLEPTKKQPMQNQSSHPVEV